MKKILSVLVLLSLLLGVQFAAADSGNLWNILFPPDNAAEKTGGDPEMSLPMAIDDLSYDGKAVSLIIKGESPDGTFYYALGAEPEGSADAPTNCASAAECPAIDTNTWSTTVPEETDAGTYYVYWYIKGDPNHNDTAPKCLTVTINPAPLTITANPQTYTYNGSEQGPAGTYKSGFETYITIGIEGEGGVISNGLQTGDSLSSITMSGSKKDYGNYPNLIVPSAAVIKKGTETVTSNYTITYEKADLTINQKEIIVSGITAVDKTYDGNTTATLVTANAVLSGKANGDDLTVTATGTFTDANVGENKTVNISGLTLSGTGAGNYILASTGQQETTTANITAKSADDQDITAAKDSDAPLTYNGNPQAPAITVKDDEKTLTPGTDYTITYEGVSPTNYPSSSNAPKDAGTYNVVITFKGNYTGEKKIPFTIDKQAVTVSGIKAHDKTYDGGTDATLDYSEVNFAGKVSEDKLTISATGAFADSKVGNGKTVTISNLVLGGDDEANYKLSENGHQTETTANITAKAVTVSNITADSKTYDGNTNATLVTTAAVFSGKLDGDTLTVTATGTFDNANVGNGKTVTLSNLQLSGESAGNYTLAAEGQQASTTADITAKEVKVSGITANNKVYDGNTTATLVTTAAKFDGKLDGDTLTVTATGTFDNANVGEEKTVTLSNLQLGGESAGNYTLASEGQQTITTANITAKTTDLTAKQEDNEKLVYNGTTNKPTLEVKDGNTTELVEVTDYTVKYEGKSPTVYTESSTAPTNAGTYLAKITYTGNYSGSYTVEFTIDKRPVTVSGVTAQDKTYDGTKDVTLETSNAVFVGIVNGDSLTVTATGAFEDPNVGNNKTVNIGSLTLGGSGVDNYILASEGQQKTAAANITAKSVESSDISAAKDPNETMTYSGTSQAPTLVVKDDDKRLEAGEGKDYTVAYVGVDPTEYQSSATPPTNAGSYKAVITFGGNYSGTKEVEFSIDQKALTIKAKDQTITYGSSIAVGVSQVTADGLVDGDSLTAVNLTPSADTVTTTGTITPNDAETLNGADNYNISYENGKLTIEAKTDGLTAAQKDGEKLVYDGEPNPPTLVVKDGDQPLTPETDYTVKYVGVEPTSYGPSDKAPKDAGNYKAIVEFKGNYDGEKEVPFTIEKADFSGLLTDSQKAKDNDLTYKKDEQTKEGVAQELVTGPQELPTGFTGVQYSTDGQNYTDEIPTGTNADVYPVYVKYIGDGNHNDFVYDGNPINVTIKKANPDYEPPKGQTLTYSGSAQDLVTEGVVKALDPAELELSELVFEPAEENYAETIPSESIQKDSDSDVVNPTGLTLTYTGAKQELVSKGSTSGGTMEYTLGDRDTAPTEGWNVNVPAETDAGIYYIWYRIVGDENYNDVAPAYVITTILKANTMTVNAVDYSGTYDGHAHYAGGQASVADGTTLTYSTDGQTWTAEAPSITNVGTLTYRVKAENRNYEDAYSEGTITINKISPTEGTDFTAPIGQTGLVYNGSAQELLAQLGQGKDGKLFSFYYGAASNETGDSAIPAESEFTADNPTRVNAGTYLVYWFIGGSANTDAMGSSAEPANANDPITVTIEKQTLNSSMIVLSPKETIFDGRSQEVSVTISAPGLEESDWEFTEDSQLTGYFEGSYKVCVRLSENNTNFTTENGEPVCANWEIKMPEPPAIMQLTYIGDVRDHCDRCQLPNTGFPSRVSVPLSVRPEGLEYKNVNMRIQIPTLNLDREMVEIPYFNNSWPVEWLGEQIGLLSGSALPGEGIAILAAHNTLNNTEIGPFAQLFDMDEQDTIFVSDAEGDMKLYRVYANELVSPNGFDEIAAIAADEPNSLILLTCENESVEGGYLNRRVVFAKPIR